MAPQGVAVLPEAPRPPSSHLTGHTVLSLGLLAAFSSRVLSHASAHSSSTHLPRLSFGIIFFPGTFTLSTVSAKAHTGLDTLVFLFLKKNKAGLKLVLTVKREQPEGLRNDSKFVKIT